MEFVELESQSRGYPALDVERLSSAVGTASQPGEGVSLQVNGWSFDNSCLTILWQALYGNAAFLKELILTDCRWKFNKDSPSDAIANMVLALASNTFLTKLVFHNTRLPPMFLENLSSTLSSNKTLTHLDLGDSFVNGREMALLLAALALSSLHSFNIPILLDTWTNQLQEQLQGLLSTYYGNDPHSACHGQLAPLQKVKFAFQAMPCTSFYNTSPESIQRKQVWNIWKTFLLSCPTNGWQELEASNLTERELLELVDIITVTQQQNSQLQKLHLNGQGVTLETLTRLVNRLCLCNKTSIRANLNFTLYNGEELASRTLSLLPSLAKAVQRNYVIDNLTMKCAEYAIAPGKDLTLLCNKEGTLIQSTLALNRAGRRYMLENPANMERGLSVLSCVRHDIDATFAHLNENPSLLCQQQLCLPAQSNFVNNNWNEQEILHEWRLGNKRKCLCFGCAVQGKEMRRGGADLA